MVNYPNIKPINPNYQAIRAKVAAFVYQALVSAGKAEMIPYIYVVKVPISNISASIRD
ncbi:hypothetical protein RINTHH_950 [Richelia intracellularis HH01]|uniref:Uncharacterized protein n=1 Tax=Richelia intracellularis HH01 TaxID=1165094 RepID=M1X258_9NOST|nr:hypothetical protein RINTHH_950 [Richelia intracellularis HH01]